MTDKKLATLKHKYIKYKTKYYNYVKKLLKESIYPTQGNDFNLLTIPKGHPNAGKTVPVDYLLKNIVLYLWDHGFITAGWDQGFVYGNQFYPAFVSFDKKTISGKDTLTKLQTLMNKIFGKKNIFIHEDNKYHTKEEIIKILKEQYEEQKRFFSKYPRKIWIDTNPGVVSLYFNGNEIPWISEKMGIPVPSHEESLPGGLIIYNPIKSD